MTFEATLILNKEIMQRIKSKYPDGFPLGFNNADARYYKALDKEVIKAERYLAQSKKTEPDP